MVLRHPAGLEPHADLYVAGLRLRMLQRSRAILNGVEAFTTAMLGVVALWQ